jgi:hypothetical protein
MAPRLLRWKLLGVTIRPARRSLSFSVVSRERSNADWDSESSMIAIVIFILAFPALRKYVYPLLEGLRDVREASLRSRQARTF